MASEMAAQVGMRIRARREFLKLNQRELAERIDEPSVTNQTVSNWERGVNRPSDRYLEKIASALDVDTFYFLKPPQQQKGQTPDVVGHLNGEASQLDRLEQKVDRLLAAHERVAQAIIGMTFTRTKDWESFAATAEEAADLVAEPLDDQTDQPAGEDTEPAPTRARRVRRHPA